MPKRRSFSASGILVDIGKQTIRDSGISTVKKQVSIDDVRTVGDWARTFTWNICFADNDFVIVPRMFGNWMPATEISLDIAGVESQDFAAGVFNLSIPKNSPAYKLTVTFLDEYRLIIMDWLNMWLNSIVDIEDGNTLPIKDASCVCRIALFDSIGQTTYYGSYYVYPSFTQQIQRNSSSEIVNYQVEFNVTGVIEDLPYTAWNYESISDVFRRDDITPFHDHGVRAL